MYIKTKLMLFKQKKRALLFTEESRCASALSVGCVTKGVVLAIAHITTIATISVHGTRSMAMVPSVARLANTPASPGMASAKKP